MGLGDFWLQSNNGKRISLENLKELKKSDLKNNPELMKLFDFFNTNKSNGSEEVLDKQELNSLFNTMQKSAQSSKGKDSSIFETEEAEDFINSKQTSDGKTLELGVKASDMFEFLSKLIKPDNEQQYVSQHLHNTNLTEEQLAQEAVIRNLSNDTDMAITLLELQNNGAVTDLYDKYKEWRDDDLSLSNVEEAVVLQQEGVYNLQKAKDGTLSKKEYFLQNREHLKTMMKRRLFRKDENTGLDFLDRNRGKMTKKEFEKLMEDYINMKIDSIADLDKYKSLQRGLITLSDSEIEQRFINIKKEAEQVDKYSYDPMGETKSKMDYSECIPVEYDTTESMTFEEVFKFERNQEYSKEKVMEYLKDDTAINYTSEELVADSLDIINNEHAEQELKKFDSNYKMAFGYDSAQDLVESMEQDNKEIMDTIDEVTDVTQIAGLGCTVVGGILCFTPAAAVGAGLITLGNSISIGGLAAENVVGYTEALTRQNINPEEIEELNNSLLMDAGGFLIGAAAGKVGMKAFNKLIDVKLAEVFKTQIAQGNRMEALKQVFKNPEYLKNFMQAAGVKLSADFLISYAGDLAMSEALGTDDDWKSLLQSNLIGLAAGTSGDIKELGQTGIKGYKYKALRVREDEGILTPKEADELAALRNDPDIQRGYPNKNSVINEENNELNQVKTEVHSQISKRSQNNINTEVELKKFFVNTPTQQTKNATLQKDINFIIKRRKFDSDEVKELSEYLKKYLEYEDKIIAVLKNNENINLQHIDQYIELINKNKDVENDISYFFEIQRYHKKDLSDPFSETESYLQLLKNQNTDKDFLLKLVKNPNINMSDINWILTICRKKTELKDAIRRLSGKKYSLDTIKSKLKAIDKYPVLSSIILEPNPRFKLIDETPSKTLPEIIEKRKQLAEFLENNFNNEFNNLKTTLGEDFFINVKWEEIIPENTSDKDIKSILSILNEKCKFFTRLDTNERRYGKDIQFAHAMYVSALSASEKIKAGESFNDVIQYIAKDYHGYDEKLYVNSFKTDKFDEDRLYTSGKYRGLDIYMEISNYISKLRGRDNNDLFGVDYAHTPFNNTGGYSEYYDRFVAQANKREDYTLTVIEYNPNTVNGYSKYRMRHPAELTVNSSMKKINKNFKSLQPLFKKVKKGNNLTAEEIKKAHEIIAEMYYRMANTMPFERGSNGISDVFMRSCYKALGIEMPVLRKNVSLDLEAFCTDMDEYKMNWLNFFEQ